MKTYEFTIIIPEIDNETSDAIYSKCVDASLGKCNESTYVSFDRKAIGLEEAIESAIVDLRSVGIEPLHVEMEIHAAV